MKNTPGEFGLYCPTGLECLQIWQLGGIDRQTPFLHTKNPRAPCSILGQPITRCNVETSPQKLPVGWLGGLVFPTLGRLLLVASFWFASGVPILMSSRPHLRFSSFCFPSCSSPGGGGNPHHSLWNFSCSFFLFSFSTLCRILSSLVANHSSLAASCSSREA